MVKKLINEDFNKMMICIRSIDDKTQFIKDTMNKIYKNTIDDDNLSYEELLKIENCLYKIQDALLDLKLGTDEDIDYSKISQYAEDYFYNHDYLDEEDLEYYLRNECDDCSLDEIDSIEDEIRKTYKDDSGNKIVGNIIK